MRCEEVIKVIEDRYPVRAALGFDNVGLLAGRMDKEVHKIYIAIDATDEVIEEAIAFGADMLVTHHPLIFSPLKRVTDQDFIGRRVVQLIQKDISYYAMHTNYDVLGMADLAAAYLGLQNVEVLDVTGENVIVDPESAEKITVPEGIGKVGNLAEVTDLENCCNFVKCCFDLDSVRVFGDLNKHISRLAICPGSGKSVIDAAIEKGADVLVAGDIGHHEGIDAVARGLAVIDAGHYGTEYIFMNDMKEYFEKHLPEIITGTAAIVHPFQTV